MDLLAVVVLASFSPAGACAHTAPVTYTNRAESLHFSAFHFLCVFVYMITQSGDSALILAAWLGHTDVITELVNAGVNLDLQNKVLYLWYILLRLCTCVLHYVICSLQQRFM